MVQSLLLAGWLVSTDGVLPGLVALLASWEEAHGVELSSTEGGRLRLVLVDLDPNEEEATDGWLTRFLHFLAGESPQEGPTHDLAFADIDEARLDSRALTLPAASLQPAEIIPQDMVLELRPARRGGTGRPARPPTDGGRSRAFRGVMLC